jgi:hypothetical protein
MILPSKHISQEKALLTVGAELLKHLDRPRTVSAVWEDVHNSAAVSYDWFILALDLLYTMDAVEVHDGLLSRRGSS